MQHQGPRHQPFIWRNMRTDDLVTVVEIAAQLHPAYPEDEQIYIERLTLYPQGCLVLEINGEVLGYAISHPWLERQVPALNSLLYALPVPASTYYIHDVALLPSARGLAAVAQLLLLLTVLARHDGLSSMSLTAVNHSHDFWVRHGFVAISDPALQAKLNSYDLAAHFLVRDVPAKA